MTDPSLHDGSSRLLALADHFEIVSAARAAAAVRTAAARTAAGRGGGGGGGGGGGEKARVPRWRCQGLCQGLNAQAFCLNLCALQLL
jgi:hypothetical protein